VPSQPILTSLLSLMVSLAGASCSLASDPPDPPSSPGVNSIEDMVIALPEPKRSESITKLAEAGVILSEERIPNVFDSLQTRRAIDAYIDWFEEPLTSARLDSLARLVGSTQRDDGARFRAAALLVRYGRSAGKEHLESEARAGKTEAARVLATAQVAGTESVVVAALVAAQGKDPALIDAISLWDSASVLSLLSTAIESEPGRADLLRASPGPIAERVENRLRDRFAALHDDDMAKVTLAARLLRATPDDPEMIAFLRQSLLRPDSPFPLWKARVADNIGRSRSTALLRDQEAVLNQVVLRLADASTGTDAVVADAGAAAAVLKSIISLGGEPPMATVRQVRELETKFTGSRVVDTTLLRSQREDLIESLRGTMPDTELARLRVIASLPLIPRRYLPASTVRVLTSGD
jgi:hypothetical protein